MFQSYFVEILLRSYNKRGKNKESGCKLKLNKSLNEGF